MEQKINIESIQPAWRSCDYALQVWISESTTIAGKRYAEEVLRKWFGDVKYFWGNCFLCVKK